MPFTGACQLTLDFENEKYHRSYDFFLFYCVVQCGYNGDGGISVL